MCGQLGEMSGRQMERDHLVLTSLLLVSFLGPFVILFHCGMCDMAFLNHAVPIDTRSARVPCTLDVFRHSVRS